MIDRTSKYGPFLVYTVPLFLFAALAFFSVFLAVFYGELESADILDKLNSRSLAVLLCCVGVYVGTVLVFEDVTEAFSLKGQEKERTFELNSKSVGSIVIVISLAIICVIAVAEIGSQQIIICKDRSLTLDKFVRPTKIAEMATAFCK